MSNSLINAHIILGSPLGDDPDFYQVADWAGELLLSIIKEIEECKKLLDEDMSEEEKKYREIQEFLWSTLTKSPINSFKILAADAVKMFDIFGPNGEDPEELD